MSSIPKIIHQTFGSTVLPELIQKNVEALKDTNPDWEYRFYDDQDIFDFIRKNYSYQVLKAYNSINPMYGAARAGFFRFDDYAAGEFQQWYIAARPDHPFLAATVIRVLDNLENYTPEKFGVGRTGVVVTTGPVAYTQAIVPVLGHAQYHQAATHAELGLIYNIYESSLGRGAKSSELNQRWPHYTKLTDPVVFR